MKLRKWLLCGTLSVAVLTGGLSAWAVPASKAPSVASESIARVNKEKSTVQKLINQTRSQITLGPEQRLADGEVLMKSKDYDRAITVLDSIVIKYAQNSRVVAEAESLLGETYFRSGQLLSARRKYTEILKSNNKAYTPFAPRAFARLVDIAIRTKQFDELDKAIALVDNAGITAEGTVHYAKGKALIVKKKLDEARNHLGQVPSTHPLFHQAKYLMGVAEMKDAQSKIQPVKLASGDKPPPAPPTRYAKAIESFRQVTKLQPNTKEHREVIDFGWLAIGRLFYEADQWIEAADAYNHIGRNSKQFPTALYELAWVYVRLGDVDRASRALEVLAVVDAGSEFRSDSTLLRADLMLRSGQFDKAVKLYDSVRAEYNPMKKQVEMFLASTNDASVYYDKLSQEELTGTNASLPREVIKWAREEQDGESAFAVIDDIAMCRKLIRNSRELIMKLRAVLNAPNRVRAFPDLKAGDERIVQLLNRLAQARGTIAEGLDDVEPNSVSGQLATVRNERRALQQRLKMLPVTDGDMAQRENSAKQQWNHVSQKLQRLQLEVDQLNAIVNGLKRMLAEGMAGGAANADTMQKWKAELDENQRDLKTYTKQITEVRRLIETGRVQVGYGDQRFVDDEKAREAFKLKLREEVNLVAAGAAGSSAAAYANQVKPILDQADNSEADLNKTRNKILAEVAAKTTELSKIINEEAGKISSYTQQLDSLDQEARLVVGQVAMRNFGRVRDKLRKIILRADVGTVELAWEVREEQQHRVKSLLVERVRQQQVLNQELREVLDDSNLALL
jgi:tetratricopeptide (TPR) repeat protein/DNA-binding transcriptional ArsR family regulator